MIFSSLAGFLLVGAADLFPNDPCNFLDMIGAWLVFFVVGTVMQFLIVGIEILIGTIKLVIVYKDEDSEK